MTESEFEQLFKKQFTRLANIAFTVLKDEDTAKDVVQQVFIKLWNNRGKMDFDDRVDYYLNRAVINTAINHLDKVKKLEFNSDSLLLEQVQNPYEDKPKPNEEQLANAIKNAVEQLPGKCQSVFSLSRYEGMTNQEIAQYLNISVKAVEKHISRALKELRVSLKPYMKFISFFLYFGVGFRIYQLSLFIEGLM